MGAPQVARRRGPRKYLRAEERRQQLLVAASEIVGTRGWEALGMVSLADAAGVSRQLVYEHFENLDILHVEVTRFLFEGVFGAVRLALERHPEDTAAAVRTGLRLMLDLPAGSRLALRQLTAGASGASDGLRRLHDLARHQVTELWVDPIRRQTGVGDREARAAAWLLNVASWALFDLVDDGTFTPEQAADFFVKTSLAVMGSL